MHWKGKYYVNLILPFGLRSAPGIFNNVAYLFEWMLTHNLSVEDLLHYQIAKRLVAIHEAARLVGIPLFPEKCEGPTTRTVILGIELDSVEMSAQLPEDKLAGLIVLLRECGNKKSCKPKDLQFLLGNVMG